MSEKTKKAGSIRWGQTLTVCLMMFCLTYLTAINYVLYPSDTDTTAGICANPRPADNGNDYPPSGPSEEKSCGGSGFTLAEEMLHETHPELNFKGSNELYPHHLAKARKIAMFHPELVLPPPKL